MPPALWRRMRLLLVLLLRLRRLPGLLLLLLLLLLVGLAPHATWGQCGAREDRVWRGLRARRRVGDGLADALNIKAQRQARAAVQRAEGGASWCEEVHLTGEGPHDAKVGEVGRPLQAKRVVGRAQDDGRDVGQRGQEALNLGGREVVRHIEHKACLRARATDALEVRPEGLAVGFNAVPQATAKALLKPLSVLHSEDEGLVEGGKAPTGCTNGAPACKGLGETMGIEQGKELLKERLSVLRA